MPTTKSAILMFVDLNHEHAHMHYQYQFVLDIHSPLFSCVQDSEIFIKATGAPTVKITGGKIIIDFGFSADLVASRNCSACTVRGASVHITPC